MEMGTSLIGIVVAVRLTFGWLMRSTRIESNRIAPCLASCLAPVPCLRRWSMSSSEYGVQNVDGVTHLGRHPVAVFGPESTPETISQIMTIE